MTARRFAPYVRPALVNGAAGAVAFDDERPFAVLAFTVVGDRAVAIDVFNDPEFVAQLDMRGITT
jgi:RNA polymerase sigma-70 factor (ECF subfamily)